MKKSGFLLLVISIVLFSCKKSHDTTTNNGGGNDLNKWTFKQGSTTYSGGLLFESALLNTTLQSNNTYSLSMIGPDSKNPNMFNLILSLADTTFTVKNYQSGNPAVDLLNGFYYFEVNNNADNIYKSADLDPGQIMNYTITSYDPVKDVVTITFSGKAVDKDGNEVSITDGKVIAKIDR